MRTAYYLLQYLLLTLSMREVEGPLEMQMEPGSSLVRVRIRVRG